MSSHNVHAFVMLDGATWTDVSTEVREGTIRSQRGFTEFGQLRPARLDWRFGNVTDKWRPTNPTSSVYGSIGRAMPMQVTCDGAYINTAEASDWKPDQTAGFTAGPPVRGDRWVDVTGQGVLGRIGSWDDPLESPVVQYTRGYANLVGFWPCEEGSNATQLTNILSNGEAGKANGVTFGDSDAPYGSTASLVLNNGDTSSTIAGRFVPGSATAGWQIGLGLKLAAAPTVSGLRQIIAWTTSNGYSWAINIDVGAFNVSVYDGAGSNLLNQSVLYTDPTVWNRLRVRATASGGTVTVELAWYPQDQPSPFGLSWTFSGSVGALRTWTANGNSTMKGARVSGVIGLQTGLDDLTSYNDMRAFDGYIRETAGRRFLRLLAAAGITANISGDPDDTAPMGRQRAATLYAQLQEIANTDQALIYDSSTSIAVRMRTRKNLYGQTPIVFTFPTDIAPPLNERFDFVGVANLVTASQNNGGDATVELTSGPMSTAPAPAGIGKKKTSVDVNVGNEASQLQQVASWVLANDSTAGPRYPQIVVDLEWAPGALSRANAVELGSLLRLDGRAENSIYLIVIGIDQQIDQYRRVVTFTCVPGDVYAQLTTYGAAVPRYDAVATVLGSGVTAGATAVVFKTPLTEVPWHTTATPYDVMVSGERWTVTTMGAASVVSGFYQQNATVTRAVNGVSKAQAAGAPIHIATPGRYAL